MKLQSWIDRLSERFDKRRYMVALRYAELRLGGSSSSRTLKTRTLSTTHERAHAAHAAAHTTNIDLERLVSEDDTVG